MDTFYIHTNAAVKMFMIRLQGLLGMSKSSLHVSHLNVCTDSVVNTYMICMSKLDTCEYAYDTYVCTAAAVDTFIIRTNAAVNMFMIRLQRVDTFMIRMFVLILL